MMSMKTQMALDRELYLSKQRRKRKRDEFDNNLYMTGNDKVMHRAGKAIQRLFPDLRGRTFPTNNYLAFAVWSPSLRGTIGRDLFRQVCDNLRNGFSPCGDC